MTTSTLTTASTTTQTPTRTNQELTDGFLEHIYGKYLPKTAHTVKWLFKKVIRILGEPPEYGLTPDYLLGYIQTEEGQELSGQKKSQVRSLARRLDEYMKNGSNNGANANSDINKGEEEMSTVVMNEKVKGVLNQTLEEVRQRAGGGQVQASRSSPQQFQETPKIVITSDRQKVQEGVNLKAKPAKSMKKAPDKKPVPKAPTPKQVVDIMPDQQVFRLYKVVDGGLEKLKKDYTYKDFVSAGGFESFMEKYIYPEFGDNFDYSLFQYDEKSGTETKLTTMSPAKKMTSKDPEVAKLENVMKISDDQREKARADALRQIDDNKKVYDKIFEVLQAGGGGGSAIAKEMISLEMVGQMIKTMRTPEETKEFTPKLMEVLNSILQRVSEPQKPQNTFTNDFMQIQAMNEQIKMTRQMMKNMSAEDEDHKPSRFDGPSIPFLPPPPVVSKGEELASILTAVKTIMPPPPEKKEGEITSKDLMTMMMENNKAAATAQQETSRQIMALMEKNRDNEIARMMDRIEANDKLMAERFTALQSSSQKGGLAGFVTEFKALQEVNQTLGLGGNAGGFMDFVAALPEILNSAGDFYFKIKSASGPNALVDSTENNGAGAEAGSGGEGENSTVNAEKLIQVFGSKLGRAIQENSKQECLVAFEYLIRNGSKLKQYQPLIAVVFEANKEQLSGYIEQLLTTLYGGEKLSKEEKAQKQKILVSMTNLVFENRERLQKAVAQ